MARLFSNVNMLDIISVVVGIGGLFLALWAHYKIKANIFGLIEKLRASRNNLYMLDRDADRIFRIIEAAELGQSEKMESIRQISSSIHKNMQSMTNTIDDGNEWGNLSIKRIYELISK